MDKKRQKKQKYIEYNIDTYDKATDDFIADE